MAQIYFLERILKDLFPHLFFIFYLFTRTFIFKITRVMKTKLTLVMDDAVIYNAKKYAKKADTSLSSMVENYLKALANEKFKNNKNTSPKKLNSVIEKYRGIISLPADYDYKKEIANYLLEKYNKLK